MQSATHLLRVFWGQNQNVIIYIYIYINMYSNRVQQDIKRKQSRESVSKADLPADIFEQYKKVSEFTVLNLKDLNKKGKGGA